MAREHGEPDRRRTAPAGLSGARWSRRDVLRFGGTAAGVLVAGMLAGCTVGRPTGPTGTPSPGGGSPTTGPVTTGDFPIGIATDGRSFVDAGGRPFYYISDTAWNAISRMTMDEFETLAAARHGQGFTALQLSLLDFDPSARNVYGKKPFASTGALDKPVVEDDGDDYWGHVDRCIDVCEELGLVVCLVPCWYGGWGDAWRGHLTEQRAQDYGSFLAERFGGRTNVWWLLGGDNAPTDEGESTKGVPGDLDRGPRLEETMVMGRALAEGAAVTQLMSYHTARTLSAEEYFGSEPWYQISAAYSGDDPVPYVSEEYARETVRPVVLWEAYYDERTREPLVDRRGLRAQAYHALLSGAAGFAYGHSLVYPVRDGWEDALDAQSARDIGRFSQVVASFGGGALTPVSHAEGASGVLPDGYGTGDPASQASAALLPDGAGAVAYFGEPRAIVAVDTTALDPDAAFEITWIDPATGDQFFVAEDTGTSVQVSWPSDWTDALLVITR